MSRYVLLIAILLSLIRPAVAQPSQPKSSELIAGPQQPISTTQTQASRPPLPTPWRQEETSTPTIAQQSSAQLSALVERRVINTLGKTPEAGLIISNVVYSGDWAFGTIAIPPGPSGDAPDFDLFIARREGDRWSVALTGEPRFEQWREQAPEDLPIMRSTRVAGQSATGNGSARLRLPWTVGETWTLTGGPHNNLGYAGNGHPIVDRPWSSLDFDGGSRIVRPARGGIAYRPCADFVVIDHGDGWYTGYYHLDQIAVTHAQHIPDDRLNTVILGYASTRIGCGGTRISGPHLHFSLRYGSAGGFVNIHGHAIGGWTVEEGGAPYHGCMVRNGNRQCAGQGQIYNDGRVGNDSGGGNNRPPNTPSPISPGDWHVARDGRAPRLCWNNPGDPDGDSVTFFAEVFESAVNAQSGWTSETCWRPAALDGRAFGYQWRVKARDSRGAESGWSTVWHFTIENPPPPSCPQSGGVILYQHAGYNCGGEGEGAGYVVRSAPGFQNVPGSFNDRASSVIVPSGWSVMLYEHSNAGGGRRCIDAPGDNDFSNDTFDNGVRLNDAVSSFEVFSVPGCRTSQSNRPPNTPSPVSPGDWHVARDGRAPTLCWNNPGDPDGDSVTFFAEVFESAVNAQSGWIGDTCWRPAALDGRAFGYQWRVKARDSRGAESGWSAVWHFTIENPPPPPNNNWQAQYWDNRELRGSPRVSTSEGGIYLVRHWGWGGGPHGLPGDNWSARFVKTLYFPGGHYRFHCQHDDGCRLYIDSQLRIDHWWDSSFGGADWGGHLSAGNHEIKVEYYEKTGEAALEVWWQGPGFLPRDESCDYNNGWCAEYYLNRDVRGTAAIRRSEGQSLALDWGNGSPGPTFPADNFSSRFMRRAHFTCGTYRFHFFTDDGIRFWVNDALRLDQWRDQVASYYVDLNLNTGHHTLRVEHYENGGGAAIRAWWEKLADCQPTVAIDHASTHYARPGASVDPTVRVRVTAGHLDGGRGDALAFVGGASLGAAANQPLYGFVQEGGAYTFNVANSDGFRMTAPASEGSYESRWQVRAAGSLVGPVATVRVVVDDTPPAVVIQSPGDSAYINSNTVVLRAAPQDANGVDQVQFFAGYDDGSGWAWRNLGWDTNGADGWQITWNVSAVPDQVGVALYAYAWDLAGNGAGAARWDITLDRTPPSAAIQSLPANQDSTAFIVWWNSGPDISDISRYDLQVQEDGGPWQDWLQNVGPQYVGAWFVGELGRRYAFRIRATDRAGNVSAYSPPVETVIRTCAPDAYEPDNERSAARALPPGQPQMRTFCGAGDHDWVIFQVRPGQRFAIYTTDLGWTTDTVLTLFDAAGNVLAESDDVNYPEDLSSRIEITWTAAYTGTFYARVQHFNRRVAGDGVTYRLVFSPLHRLHLPMVQR
jgi:hypothetical protein